MLTVILIGLVTFLYFLFFKIKFNYWKRRNIKGPKVNPFFPFFGTIFEEISLPAVEIEQKFLKEYGQIFGTFAGCKPILNISKPEYIKEIINDLKTFPSGGTFDFNDKYLSQSMFFKSGHDWKTTRAAQTHYFTSKKFRSLFCHFEKVTNNFLIDLATVIEQSKTGDVEIKKLSNFYTVDVIGKVLFAVDSHAFEQQNSIFVKSSTNLGDINYIQSILVSFLPTAVSKYLRINLLNFEPMHMLGDYFKEVLKKRKETGIKYNDLSELIQDAIDDGKVELTEDELIGNILLSFFAGVEAVSNTITHMFFFLAEHPDIQAKLNDEIVNVFDEEIKYEDLSQNEYLSAVVDETLRLGVSFLSVGRTAVKDTKIGDINIEKGTTLNLITYLPNISTDNYKDPQTFNPERFLKSEIKKDNLFIPFGLGPKHCLGKRLALIETKYLFVRLLKRYEILKAKDSGIRRSSSRGVNAIDALNVAFKERCN